MSTATIDDEIEPLSVDTLTAPAQVSIMAAGTSSSRGVPGAPAHLSPLTQPSGHALALFAEAEDWFSPDVLDTVWHTDEVDERLRCEQLRKRLIQLEAALYEDYGSRLDADSVGAFWRLFVAYPAVSAPSLSSSPEGVLLATWRRNRDEVLSIRCAGATLLHFSWVARSSETAGTLDRHWGSTHSPATFFVTNPTARSLATGSGAAA